MIETNSPWRMSRLTPSTTRIGPCGGREVDARRRRSGCERRRSCRLAHPASHAAQGEPSMRERCCGCRGDRAGKAVGGRAAALRCGGRRCAPTALRCSRRGATSTTRPWVQGLRHVEVVAEYRSNPAALRSSAPQRRSAARPPTALQQHRAARRGAPRARSLRLDALSRAAPSVPAEVRVGGGCGASAAPSSAAQRGESGAQRRTGEKRLWAGPVQGPEPNASQPPRGASSAGQPARSGGRRSEAAPAARPHLCDARSSARRARKADPTSITRGGPAMPPAGASRRAARDPSPAR